MTAAGCVILLAVLLMKSLSAILIALLLVHLQCSGTCLSDALKSPATSGGEKAPCHKQENGSNEKSSHQTDNPCRFGQVLDSKIGAGKYVLGLNVSLPVMVSAVRPPTLSFAYTFLLESSSHPLPSPAIASVLRI
jgi:hypothetical protein